MIAGSVRCAYVAATEASHSEYAIEVMGARYPAQRHGKAPYDPERKAILA